MCRRIIKTFSNICRFQHKFRAASSLFTQLLMGGGEESSSMKMESEPSMTQPILYTNLKIIVLMAGEYYSTEIPLVLWGSLFRAFVYTLAVNNQHVLNNTTTGCSTVRLIVPGALRSLRGSTLTLHCMHQLGKLPLSKTTEFILGHRSL